MKKIFTVLVVALVAMTCVFAAFDATKLSVGVGVGFSDDVVQTFGRDFYHRGHFDGYGFDLAVRGDYAFKENTAVTAMFNWNIIAATRYHEKSNYFAKWSEDVKLDITDEHLLGVMAGVTKSFKIKPVDIALTVGPELRVSCTSGNLDLGVKGIVKGSYAFPKSHFSVDVTLMGDVFLVRDGKWFSNYNTESDKYFFVNNTVLAGVTYKF